MDSDGMKIAPAVQALWGQLPDGAQLQKLRGDASTRSYYRLSAPGASLASAIVMRLPDDALGSDEGTGDAPAPTELPFINVGRHLETRGVRVPKVYVDHTRDGVLLLEDLGDETFEERLLKTDPSGWGELYGQAVDLMVRMHIACEQPDPGCLAYGRSFDRKLLRWEFDHFEQWGLVAAGHPVSEADSAALGAHFDRLVGEMLQLPQGFVHRDYQSRNLMWVDGELVVIDFQDALGGPAPYDLVALLCDSYVDLSEELQTSMIARYAELRGYDSAATQVFERGFWRTAIQRKLKDAGRFVFIDQVRGNPDFLPWYAPSLKYVGRALRRAQEDELAQLLGKLLPGFPDAVGDVPLATGSRTEG